MMKNYFGRKVTGKGLSSEAEARVREIVREELAALESETVTFKIGSSELGRAAAKAINDLQRKSSREPLDLGGGTIAGSIISSSRKSLR